METKVDVSREKGNCCMGEFDPLDGGAGPDGAGGTCIICRAGSLLAGGKGS